MHFEAQRLLSRTLQEGNAFLSIGLVVPALAGFQSEHAVEIPFMLTTKKKSKKKKIANLAARGSKRLFIGGVWDYSSNWKCSGEGFS